MLNILIRRLQRRVLLMPLGGLLIRIANLTDGLLVKRLAGNLETDGQTVRVKAARHLKGRQPGKRVG